MKNKLLYIAACLTPVVLLIYLLIKASRTLITTTELDIYLWNGFYGFLGFLLALAHYRYFFFHRLMYYIRNYQNKIFQYDESGN
jgi:hypothetical protein